MAIYTKTGDDGTTSLYGGKRVSKADSRIELTGTIDELNSWIGMLGYGDLFTRIQSDLFSIGSFLSGGPSDIVVEQTVRHMEMAIDGMGAEMKPLHNFIYPHGTAQIARAVCRRTERLAVREKVDPRIIRYLNRLSDYLFQLGRFRNAGHETLWSGIPRK